MPYQPNTYIWLLREKNVRFSHTIFVETQCTSKLLQGEMCRSSIDNMTWLIMKNMPVVGIWLLTHLCPVYSCRGNLEVHRYFLVFLPYVVTGHLGILMNGCYMAYLGCKELNQTTAKLLLVCPI